MRFEGCVKRAGPNIDYMCSRCPAREPYVPTAWFSHIWWLYRLQRSKYPFNQADLSIDEWLGLGEMHDAMEMFKQKV